jgi:AcrR family transcriptional regulator
VIGTVAERREARRSSIVATAWNMAQSQGIGGLSLHALARAVGIRQPSLYAYFESKLALYDAMFADGNRQLLEHLAQVPLPSDPRAAVKAFMRAFAGFAVEDTARAALLFQRPIPGFQPSAESYECARAVFARAADVLAAAGVHDQGDLDCIVAIVGGLIDAQISNDPGGDRWLRHLDRLIDLHLDDIQRRGTQHDQ